VDRLKSAKSYKDFIYLYSMQDVYLNTEPHMYKLQGFGISNVFYLSRDNTSTTGH